MNAQSTTLIGSDALRVKTLATRLIAAEMRAVEVAAKSSAISQLEWLRDAALAHLKRPRVAQHPLVIT
jgi:hypothetical protein